METDADQQITAFVGVDWGDACRTASS